MIFGKLLNKYYLRYIHWFLLGAIALIIIDLIQLEVPETIGKIVDGLTPDSDGALAYGKSELFDSILVILWYTLIIVAGRVVWRLCIFGTSRIIETRIRSELFAHCEKLSASFYSEHKTGELMTYFTNDLMAVRMSVGPGVMIFIDVLFLTTLTFIKMYTINARLAFFASIPLVLITVTGLTLGRNVKKKFKKRQDAFADLSDLTQETLAGINVTKAFVKEETQIKAFEKVNRENYYKIIIAEKMALITHILIFILTGLNTAIVIGVGSYLVSTGALTAGQLTQFLMLIALLVWPMGAIGRMIIIRSQGKASLNRIETIMNHPIEVKDSADVIDLEEVKGKIEFKNFNFTYPDANEPVLKNINFTIEKGEKVGIVGRTGCGKSTLVDLLLRLYNVEKGTLLIDDIDIMNLPIHKIRDEIGYVPQENFLFSDNIKNNIALGIKMQEDGDEEIIKAAKLSNVHENIMEFKEQYETVVGERGVTLSGGQKQRVAIARALIKNPSILIMDDSVSAVDTKTEESILEALNGLFKNKTTIIIAHRLSTIKDVDKIIVMDEGQIKSIGTHDELLENSPLYIEMVKMQELEEEQE